MDLRVVKTRKHVREAFLKLRAETPLEKVKVTELCELAMINKTTFYKHYQDIYALSEEIEDETILAIMKDFLQMDCLFTDPAGFFRGLYYAFLSNQELILILFSGRMDVLVSKVEKQLIVHYPRLNAMPERRTLLSLLLWGGSHVLTEGQYPEEVLLDTLTRATQAIISIIEEPAV
jgi:AcrR family transcriptional regulator